LQIVLKSGSLNLLELSGPVQACNEISLLYRFKFSHCQEKEERTGHFGWLRAEQPGDLGSVCGMNNLFFSPKRPDRLWSHY
jgi:hypothetical protein